MTGLNELYQDVILHHYKSPRNYGELPGHNRAADGHNPLCGDRIHLTARVEDGRIADLRFQGSGCAISTASASVMTEAVKGKTEDEIRALFQRFHDLVTGKPAGDGAELGKLEVFSGVSEFPVRVKCATLCWHTLQAALKNTHQTVSTE
ncbi:MAG: SUF system NifU family Fe-S cluster assembly protein [Planctomycetota bacterium]|nr:MAG: SUF system NifU family Fe-S cluster assembly protein [Planctomycetota bacterium]